MDVPGNSDAALAAVLGDIGAVNRWLGGTRVLFDAVWPSLRDLPSEAPVSVLDVGTGAADVPVGMVRRARRAGRALRVTAVDLDPVTAAIAARQVCDVPEVRVIRADAFRLPFPDAAFDFVTASLFVHHFAHDEAVRLLVELRRVARRAVIVNDLRRHWVPWAFITVVSRALRTSPMFRHDAPLSVLRGFTVPELAAIARDAGVAPVVLQRRWPFRLLMTVAADGKLP